LIDNFGSCCPTCMVPCCPLFSLFQDSLPCLYDARPTLDATPPPMYAYVPASVSRTHPAPLFSHRCHFPHVSPDSFPPLLLPKRPLSVPPCPSKLSKQGAYPSSSFNNHNCLLLCFLPVISKAWLPFFSLLGKFLSSPHFSWWVDLLRSSATGSFSLFVRFEIHTGLSTLRCRVRPRYCSRVGEFCGSRSLAAFCPVEAFVL